MGEIAEMMLDGVMCEGCGEFLGGEAPGYPRRCAGCGGDTNYDDHDSSSDRRRSAKGPRDTPCPTCGKLCRGEAGMKHHHINKHGAAAE